MKKGQKALQEFFTDPGSIPTQDEFVTLFPRSSILRIVRGSASFTIWGKNRRNTLSVRTVDIDFTTRELVVYIGDINTRITRKRVITSVKEFMKLPQKILNYIHCGVRKVPEFGLWEEVKKEAIK